MDVKQIDDAYIAHTYGRNPVTFVKGGGAKLWDDAGKEYLDFGCGIGVTGLGHANPAWVAAVAGQLGALEHVSNLYYTAPCAELARKLCARTGMKKVFFSNSGAEANECAIKTARKYSFDRYGKGRHKIATLLNSFHGRTMATLSATGQEGFHRWFDPFVDGFEYFAAGDLAHLRRLVETGEFCAVMLELVQGESGVTPLEPSFVSAVGALCAEKDVLLIVDEVQTGNGRTGTLYAYQQYGVTPDVVTTAKGLGNGLPIGATLFGDKTEATLSAGTHGSTFGGNPVACAGAIAVLDQIDDALLADVRAKGALLRDALLRCKGVEKVDGMGLMIGVSCQGRAKEIVGKCLQKGLAALTAKDRVRLLPPLNIDREDLARGIKILEEAFDETFA